MLHPILIVVCLLLRGHLSLQRKDTNSSQQSYNDMNTAINSCSIEQLSRLLTDRIAMNKALELAALKENKPKQLIVDTILKLVENNNNINFDNLAQSFNTLSTKYNEIQTIVDNETPPAHKPHFPRTLTSNSVPDSEVPELISANEERQPPPKNNHWSIDSSLDSYSYPLFIPNRNFKPPPGAKIIIEFKDKKREVSITVSPLMTVLEALKQAEIKFKRLFKNIPIDSDLINFWWSPVFDCISVDRVSTIQNNKSMIWKLTVIDIYGQLEFDDFCLPANGEVFVKPGSTIQLVYTSIRDVKEIY